MSIETKTALAGSAEATLQLSIWATAQISFLRRMLTKARNGVGPTIPLPLVIVVGHEWNLGYMEDRGQEVILWTGIPIGKTDSLLGMYQILAGVQCLVQWAEEVDRPWLEESILRPLSADL
ncbi:hypothetical protein LTS02_013254 [Friedmanniomyces endolithicus]|uniref:PD-(D/E)XK nuclease-like domain-containing protein n=1 Tax=Friedmanniomyces endolithicus TaxID=329885 RepID=A0A4U0U944_9PEZI|nr:hypothetical protein LTS09_016133 [Friedmanniomyces endolithicus]KAK0850333.1 hypothetical protein LTS02_013254 [Friedmanniomyces endolithicus]KAK0870007.1 hypothetical protein LTR87_013473 [Friedmanniomyces endolithicus]TKA31851.1 hypothetical protein B0A54_16591 [Friedmanniomyces endolithicus]